jgi:hypothetical protein
MYVYVYVYVHIFICITAPHFQGFVNEICNEKWLVESGKVTVVQTAKEGKLLRSDSQKTLDSKVRVVCVNVCMRICKQYSKAAVEKMPGDFALWCICV